MIPQRALSVWYSEPARASPSCPQQAVSQFFPPKIFPLRPSRCSSSFFIPSASSLCHSGAVVPHHSPVRESQAADRLPSSRPALASSPITPSSFHSHRRALPHSRREDPHITAVKVSLPRLTQPSPTGLTSSRSLLLQHTVLETTLTFTQCCCRYYNDIVLRGHPYLTTNQHTPLITRLHHDTTLSSP